MDQKRFTKIVYANKGDVVTCENGHPICEFTMDVYSGEPQRLPEQLGSWRQEEPHIGQVPVPVCEKCGAMFTNGIAFHFQDGWRGPDGKQKVEDKECR